MVSAPRCRPGARGHLALLLLLLPPLPGARGQCGALPRLSRAVPRDTSRTEGFPIGIQVTYRCLDGFVKIPGKSDTVVCLSNSEWSTFGEFCDVSCSATPRLKSATLSKEDAQKNYSPPGSTVTYDCRPGYESTEVKPVITCLESLTWSEAPEFCRGKSCGVPEGPEHGRAVVITNDLYGARANIICDEGFRLHGRPFIQCLLKRDQVEWSELPTCQAITCSPPPNITNGMHNGSNVEIFVYNSSVTYKCDHNFLLIGEASIHCTIKDNIKGVWNGSVPECKDPCGRERRHRRDTNGKDSCPGRSPGECGALPKLSRAVPRDTSRTEGFPIGAQVTYRCLEGFHKIPGKSDTVVCLSNSEWSTIGEFCNGGCGAPPRLKSATLSKEDGQKNYCPPGSTVTYDCRPGYESTEVEPVVTCLESLTWSESPEFCRGKSCGVPEGPEHGRAVVITNDLYGARAKIICDEGFRLHGRPFIQCLLKRDQVEWSELPTCQAITCSPPPNITNGMHNGGNVEIFVYNSSVTYKCDHNFLLIGEASIHCTTKDNINGVWNGSVPECKDPCGPERRHRRDTNGKDSCPGRSPGKSCGVPEGPEHGRAVVITNDLYGARANIICDEGFRLHGRPFIQCLLKRDQVEWSQLPTCQAITCSPPPNITNGMHNGSNVEIFVYNSSVTYKCDHNFLLIGEASIHCTTKDNINGVWNGSVPECKDLCGRERRHRRDTNGKDSCPDRSPAITCSPPPNITNGMHNGSNVEIFVYNSSVTYKCDHNFLLIGEASIHCTTKDNINGVWNGSAPECKDPCGRERRHRRDTNGKDSCPDRSPAITCSPPPNITNGMHNGSNVEIFVYNSSVTYKCDHNFLLIGEASIHCTTKDNINGVWNGSAPECKDPCGRERRHRRDTNGKDSCPDRSPAITCSPPPNITNGMHNGSNVEIFVYNSSVTYKCDHNFLLIGEASIHCTTKDNINGVWNGSAPECKDPCGRERRHRRDTNGKDSCPDRSPAITCSPPPNITNGMHNGSNVEIFVYNSSVTYKCDHNFLLIGEASIHCTTKDNINGVWNGSAPECKEPGFDTRIGIPGISSNIAIAIAIAVGAIAVIAVIAIGIFAAFKKKWKKKKGSYGVNLDSPKYHIAPEDDLQMSETKSNLIIKV